MTNSAEDRDDSLADAFRSVARLLRKVSAESLARWDLTPSQFRALRVLTYHAALRPSELSEHLRIAPRSTTEVLDGLAAKGLVARSPDPEDRRATLVTPTEHGREVAEQIRSASGSESARVFAKLTPADRAQLSRILNELLA
ncbi:MAG TPA: MarR family transcriptional regulator [Pseudonocardiaceae bacterium]|nr:MarR family transcriptional regulator [Pseudonocardiaceae bacterium]